jgi:hypothetical protein
MFYNNLFVYFRGSGVKIPRYPVTVIGKTPPELKFKDGHWETGKAGGLNALKPGDFGMPRH